MNTVCLILARKESIRVKNKNLKKINKKSLVEHTIDFAKKISNPSKIILSTDSEKIRKIGKKRGLNIPHLRPKHISKSNTSSYKSAKYEIEKYERQNQKIDAIILLQPTTPFRSIKTFNKIKKIFISDPSKPLISVKKIGLGSDRLLKRKGNFITNYDNKKKENIFIPNGAYFLILKKQLEKNQSFYSKRMNFYEIKNFKENIDIDTTQDLLVTKKIS